MESMSTPETTIIIGRDRVKISTDDAHLLSDGPRWHVDNSVGYVARKVTAAKNQRRKQYLHRVIAGLESGDGLVVDHINGDTFDNRRENLRIVSPGENAQNRTVSRGVSRFRGVTRSSSGRWIGRVRTIGLDWSRSFDTEIEAAKAVHFHRSQLMSHAQVDPALVHHLRWIGEDKEIERLERFAA
jgi:hypothetical protein